MPRMSALPAHSRTGLSTGMLEAPERLSAAPFPAASVARVAMNGLMPTALISRPLISPMAPPAASAARMPSSGDPVAA